MKKLKSIITVLIASCLGATMLSGCSNVTSKSPEKIISTAAEKLSKAKSVSYDMNMTMAAGSGETGSMDMTTNMNVDMILDPMQFQGNLSMDMGMLGNQSMKIYAESSNDQYSTYLSTDDGASWLKQSLTKEEFAQFNNSDSIQLYLTLLGNITESGKETLNGIETTKFDCTISNENLVKLLENSDMISQFGALGLDDDSSKQFYTAMGDLPFTIWVDMDKEVPVRYQFDMSDALQKMMQSLQESDSSAALTDSISITKYTVDITITGIDNIDSIEKPANLDNSQETMPEGE